MAGLFVLVAIGALYVLVPALAGIKDTWDRLGNGEPGWLTAALFLEIASFGCYVALFRAVIGRDEGIDWAQSYRITMAGLAATRLIAAGGLGGIALTVWALRRDGLDPRTVALKMAVLMVLLYAVYMGAVIVAGIGLRVGIFSGAAPFALTVLPASIAAAIVALCLAVGARGGDLGEAAKRLGASRRSERLRAALQTVPRTLAEGVRGAIELLRTRPADTLGAVGWWGFDIAVLWACLHAFGNPPPPAVLVMSYFVGMTANLLPLPGGIGGVEGGMIGALAAFGVPGGLALVGVLSYRAFSFWLPTIPGAVAYLGILRREPVVSTA